MTTRAKFKISEVRITEGSATKRNPDGTPVKDAHGRETCGPCKMVSLSAYPVYANGDPKHENTKFWDATPSGKLELGCINMNAVEHLKLGCEIYVDITVATEQPEHLK